MKTHTFIPQKYYSTLGPHEPVLKVAPGDRISTTTIDAGGNDERGEQVAHGSNPMTGPFYVQGAEPGDTLVARFERITPNRPRGWSSDRLAAHVVDPHYVPDLYRPAPGAPRQLASWLVDPSAGTAVLESPDTRLGHIQLPIAPMIGCFGVAPDDGESISTATSGPNGGNMDYLGFRAGVTAYLPVFVEGGLFFLGDGHAIQSHGEIAGTGIEISMQVDFTLDLIKGQSIHWPRGENVVEIFTAGNARPLDQALQHATTEMVRWLADSYGLDGHSAGLLMGQTAEYEIGNVFDPAYTVVCKMLKRYLPSA